MKKVIFIFNTVPVEGGLGSEAVDLLLVLSAFDANIEVYFVGDGLVNIDSNYPQKPRYTKRFKALADFGVEKVFTVGVTKGEFELPVENVSQEELSCRTDNCQRVLRF